MLAFSNVGQPKGELHLNLGIISPRKPPREMEGGKISKVLRMPKNGGVVLTYFKMAA